MNSIVATKRVYTTRERSRVKSALASALTLILVFAFVGCRPEESIRQIKVEKSRSGLASLKPVEPKSGMPAGGSDQRPIAGPNMASRMVVAIANREEATWFFKIFAPKDLVAGPESEWKSFFEKINFDDFGKPKFDLPDGWTETPSQSMMRHSTVKFPVESSGDQSLEIAVSSLAPNQDLLNNVNRWRGQLKLPRLTKETMELANLDSAGGPLLIYDDVGSGPGKGGGMRPTAPKKSQVKFVTPDGWTQGRTSSIVRVRLLKEMDDQRLQLSVTEMPASVNKWGPNVDRWLEELGIKLDDRDNYVPASESKLTVSEIDAQRIRLVSDDEPIKRGTIAIMLVKDSSAWFIKLNGPKQLVADHEKDFDAFVESFKFE